MNFFESKWPAVLLFPLSLIYLLITGIRNLLYDTGIFKQYKVGCKVISVGNITVGGTGKTPTVIFLAQWLAKQNFKVVVLSRGYSRQSKGTVVVSDGENILANVNESGDEPHLIAKRIKNIPVLVDKDRVRGAKKAIVLFSPDVIILDDAYQHRRIFRDINILMLKKSPTWGNGFVLPAGPLRESTKAENRADILWSNFDNITSLSKPFIQAKTIPNKVMSFSGNELHFDKNSITFLAVSGIANPNRFHQTCNQMDLNIVSSMTFKDHHDFTATDVKTINQKANELGIEWILTTEKDFVKLEQFPQANSQWAYLPIEIIPLNEQNLTYVTQLLV